MSVHRKQPGEEPVGEGAVDKLIHRCVTNNVVHAVKGAVDRYCERFGCRCADGEWSHEAGSCGDRDGVDVGEINVRFV